MGEFLDFMTSPWGIAIFTVVAIAVIIFFLAVNYRLFTKTFLDFLFGLIFVIVLSPCLIACALIAKSKTGAAYEKHWVIGKGGKLIVVRTFSYIEGADGKPSYISRSGIRYFPMLFDVLAGRMSLVGPSPLSVKDGTLIDDKYEQRFAVRPGIFTAASLSFAGRPEFEAMFAADSDYVKKRSLFTDVRTVFTCFLNYIRGESSSFISVGTDGYAEELLNGGKITQEQYARAEEYAKEEIDAARRAPMRVG